MRLIMLLPAFFLTGCLTTVPVKPKFPEPIESLMKACPDLKVVPEGTEKLSATIAIISENYGQYHECRAKVDSWVEWYNDQKKIYEEIK